MIYIGFSTTESPVSKLIRLVTKAKTSHVFVHFTMFGVGWVLDAGFFGVELQPFQRFIKNKKLIALVPMPSINSDRIPALMQSLGLAYDFGGLFGAFIPVMGRWFKKKWKNPSQNPSAVFCSELVTAWLQECGELDRAHAPQDTTPQDLLSLLRERTCKAL